jgi:VWFA-related protein
MKLRRAQAVACTTLLFSLPFCYGQTAPAPAASDATFRAGAQEVILDVVVRDKKGQRVTDVQPSDLEVYDNGVRRQITSFKLVEGGSTAITAEEKSGSTAVTAAEPERKKHVNPLAQVRLVTLIFNRLDLNSRTLARKASLDLLKNEFPENVFMSVLALDDGVHALQAFTNDRDLLRKAVEHATSGAYTEFISDSKRIEEDMKSQLGPAQAGESLGEQVQGMSDATGGSGGKGPTGDPAGAAMAQMMLNMLLTARSSELAQTGRTAIWGLINIVSQQYTLPGRKSILFFSPGFGIPQGMEEPWKVLISTANRFNVTFYAIDSRGLSTTNLNDDSVSQLKDASSASRANLRKGNGTVTPAMAKAQDMAIESGKANTQNTLADLAQSTGGFLIANTNDFRNDLRKVAEDIETYYQVTYNPRIDKYDGSFRKVEVKSARANLRIQSRAGYFALPSSPGAGGVIVSPFELPLMQALSSKPFPRDFSFASAGLHFRGKDNQPECSVVLDIPLGNLTLTQPKPDLPYEGGLAYVALVRNSKGEVLQKFRGEAPLSATPNQVAALKESHFLYNEHFDLPPGRYTLETAVSDKSGNKISVRKASFLVPPPAPSLEMSSVSIVRNVRDRNDNTSTQDPFLMQTKLVTPTISPEMKKASTAALSFYFVVYPDKSSAMKPKLTMQFSRDGVPLFGGSPELSAPDENGRIQYVATAPADKLEPGNYQVQFFVTQGSETARESVSFSLD